MTTAYDRIETCGNLPARHPVTSGQKVFENETDDEPQHRRHDLDLTQDSPVMKGVAGRGHRGPSWNRSRGQAICRPELWALRRVSGRGRRSWELPYETDFRSFDGG